MKSVDCPTCDGKAELMIQKISRTFRKEKFDIFEHYYRCKKCKNEFTITELDVVNINQVYNQYREKYSIPFPEQLIAARDYYRLSASRMSEILGLGTNQYRLYENNEMPTESNGTLLNLVINTRDFRDVVLRKKDTISKSEKIITHLDKLIKDETNPLFDLKKQLFRDSIFPNRFTGYRLPNFDKFANMALFFINYASFKTRLNKFLFYSDFNFYKYFGKSISGSAYAAIPMGPVPDQYEYKFSLLVESKIISLELDKNKNWEAEKFVAQGNFRQELFEKSELKIMGEVLDQLKFRKTSEIIELSHNESAWKANIDGKNLISYQDYAPELIEF